MSTRLKQLAILLESIIHEYYDLKVSGVIEPNDGLQEYIKTKDVDEEYINVDTMVVGVGIDKYIQTAAAENTGFDRAPLMKYLAHGIEQINIALQDPRPVSEEVSKTIKEKLTQLIMNMQSLVSLSKGEHITVQDKNVIIYGCSGCDSGNIIQKILSPYLKLTSNGVAEYINDIVNEHQNPLLAKEITRLTQENTGLYEKLETKNAPYKDLVNKLHAELEELRGQQSRVKARTFSQEKVSQEKCESPKSPGGFSFYNTYVAPIFQELAEDTRANKMNR